MSLFLSCLAGTSCKLYDDLSDNPFLQQFKNDTFMEFLKGIHYISFTALSIDEPIFFVINYIGNYLHSLTNKEAFKDPYEHSLFYSFLLLIFIFILYNKKVNYLNLKDLLSSAVFLFSWLFEPIFTYVLNNKEVSKYKLYSRIYFSISTFLILLFSDSIGLKLSLAYMCAYMSLSSVIQYYSLYIIKKQDKISHNKLNTLGKDNTSESDDKQNTSESDDKQNTSDSDDKDKQISDNDITNLK